jgi:hypothetical protein
LLLELEPSGDTSKARLQSADNAVLLSDFLISPDRGET